MVLGGHLTPNSPPSGRAVIRDFCAHYQPQWAKIVTHVMPLSAGTTLGFYDILSPLGKGGMGEVYRAKDTKLDREVAIKVLPIAFARDPERLARFEREAKALASLNHPNIATIYGLEESPEGKAIAMELVDGATLSSPLPLNEALRVALQIAEALEAAHEKGITHRDLKPANIMVTNAGLVKVLDFGLAAVGGTPSGSADDSPTFTMARTEAGVIMGTAAYMSPEQAAGKTADRRADVWSFGVVLYEMLTGKPLFHGETVSHTLADVLRADIDFQQLPPTTPPAIRELLKRCLDRDPKTRLQVISEARIAIQKYLANPAGEAESLRQAPPISRRGWLWPGAAALMTLAALTVSILHLREKPAPPPAAVRFQIRLPEKVMFTSSGAFTMSPDGRRAAFSAIGEDKVPRVWIQDLDALEARVLPDTYTGPNPPPFFWSPDSRFVVYSENSPRLKKADVQTGAVQDICEKPGPPIGGSWSKDGVIIFGSTSTGLWKVDAAGGTPAPLTKLDASLHERQHELPSFLPDGRHFLYLSSSAVPEESGIYTGSLDDPPDRQSRKRLLATRFGAYFAPSSEAGPGRLLFLREDVLVAQPFDPARLELSGNPSPLARGVGSVYQTGFLSATSSVLLYRTSTSIRDYQLTWFDRQGKATGTVGEPGSILQIRISPDGTHVAYRRDSPNLLGQDIWLLDINRGTSARFTFGPGSSGLPLWSPDGSELIFSSDREGVYNLYRKPANGARQEEVLLRSKLNKWALSWSRDGKFLLYSESPSVVFSDQDVWVLPMQGDRTPYPLLQTRFDESGAKFSPDGRWIAYDSNESGRYEVYVRDFVASRDSAAGGKWLVSKEGGAGPVWREDGKELVYIDLGRKVLSVSVDATPAFQAGVPQELFQIPPGSNNLAATSDLKRFLIPVPVERKASQAFTVLLNWNSALKP